MTTSQTGVCHVNAMLLGLLLEGRLRRVHFFCTVADAGAVAPGQVLIWGIEGSNVEACKNLVLAGAIPRLDLGLRMTKIPYYNLLYYIRAYCDVL